MTKKEFIFCILALIFAAAFAIQTINIQHKTKSNADLTKLQLEKAFLEGKLEQQSQSTDSLIKSSEKLYVEFKQLPTTNTIKVDIDKKYDKDINNIINMPADSTVLFLSKWLSEAASNRN
jgi:hypothetical protein